MTKNHDKEFSLLFMAFGSTHEVLSAINLFKEFGVVRLNYINLQVDLHVCDEVENVLMKLPKLLTGLTCSMMSLVPVLTTAAKVESEVKILEISFRPTPHLLSDFAHINQERLIFAMYLTPSCPPNAFCSQLAYHQI